MYRIADREARGERCDGYIIYAVEPHKHIGQRRGHVINSPGTSTSLINEKVKASRPTAIPIHSLAESYLLLQQVGLYARLTSLTRPQLPYPSSRTRIRHVCRRKSCSSARSKFPIHIQSSEPIFRFQFKAFSWNAGRRGTVIIKQ